MQVAGRDTARDELGVCLLDEGGTVLDIDGAFGRLTSLTWPSAARGRLLRDVLSWAPPLPEPEAEPTRARYPLDSDIVELSCRRASAGPVAYIVTARLNTSDSELARQLRIARQTLDLVIEASPLAILTLDQNKRVVMWNRTAEEIFGWTREEILGKPYPLVPPEELDSFEELFERVVLRGQGFTGVDGLRRRKDGSEIEVRMHTAPLRNAEGQTVGGMALLEDRTETRALEERIRHSQKMEAVGRLAGGIAHDFNNLLTVIVGMGDLLRLDPSVAGEARERVAEILRVAGSARGLVAQLMTFSRRQVIRPEILDLHERVRESGKMLERLLGESIELELDLSERRAWVRLDPTQFDQVLINLAVNAADAMPGGGTLRCTSNIVELEDSESSSPRQSSGKRHVCLEIRDTGEGIPEEVLPHIFDPFFTTKTTGKGTGLGLANVYGIVHQSGGDIEVESSPDHGTCFRIYLPMVAPPSRRTLSGPHRASLPRGAERLLLVEDNDAVRTSTAKLLRALGYEVSTAIHGLDALTQLEAGLEVDMIVTDLSMPKMGGAELARRLRPLMPELPILFMSGNLDVAELREQVEQGEVRFLQKPVTLRELARATREVLEARAAPSSPTARH